MTDPNYHAIIGELTRFKQIVLDLDRCQHGRHAADPCFGCPDGNRGNPLMPPGTLIGTTLHGRIVVPEHHERHNPATWIVPDTDQLKDVARSAAHSQSLMRIGLAAIAFHTTLGTDVERDTLNQALDEHRRNFPGQP